MMVYIACMEYGEEVAGVFSTFEKACAILDEIGPTKTNGRENCFVETWVLDDISGTHEVSSGIAIQG